MVFESMEKISYLLQSPSNAQKSRFSIRAIPVIRNAKICKTAYKLGTIPHFYAGYEIDAPQLAPDMGARMLEVVSKRDPKLVKFVAPAVKPAAKPPAEPPSDYELMLEALLNPGNRVNG